MKIAIIGAGLSGLGAAYHIKRALPNSEITIFDEKAIGAGASGACSGLIHPYPGAKSYLSKYGYVAFDEAIKLIRLADRYSHCPVADFHPITKLGNHPNLDNAVDVEKTGEGCTLKQSATVFIKPYLNSLFKLSKSKLIIQKITDLSQLNAYDYVIITAGYGIREFPMAKDLPIRFNKGQLLLCKDLEITHSKIGSGYLAVSENPNICHVGSTYEHHFVDDKPSAAKAFELLYPRVSKILPSLSKDHVVDVSSGIRVTKIGDYYPILYQADEKTFIITAMGSRGLLYHSYFGKNLAMTLRSCNYTNYAKR